MFLSIVMVMLLAGQASNCVWNHEHEQSPSFHVRAPTGTGWQTSVCDLSSKDMNMKVTS